MHRFDAVRRSPWLLGLLLVMSLDLLRQGASAQACEVRGHGDITELRVEPAGADPFVLDTIDLPMRVAPGDGRRPARVHVDAAIAFDASADPTHVPYAFAQAGDIANGVLSVTPATPIAATRARAAALDVDVALEEGVSARVGVACGAIVIGTRGDPIRGREPPQPGRSWSPVRSTLRVSARRGGRPALELRLSTPATFVLHEEAVERGWVRVRRPFAHGELHGWVRMAELVDAAGLPSEALGRVVARGNLALCPRERGTAQISVASAIVAAGTVVHALRARGAWARVPSDANVWVRHERGDDWATIVEVTGLRDHEGCASSLDRAWVAWRTVRPRPAAPRR